MRKLEFGDMVFYAIAGSILIILLWLRFLEEALGLWGVWVACGAWTVVLVHRFATTRHITKSQQSAMKEEQ